MFINVIIVSINKCLKLGVRVSFLNSPRLAFSEVRCEGYVAQYWCWLNCAENGFHDLVELGVNMVGVAAI